MSDLPVELRHKWAASRVWAARQAPYLSSALLALDPVVVEEHRDDLSAFPIDRGWHVYLDSAVLDSTDVPEIGFWLVHQVSHLLRRHADRYPLADQEDMPDRPGARRTAEQRYWNVAADAEIDDDLVAGEISLPDRAITPEAIFCPDGWLAEQYWDAISTVSDTSWKQHAERGKRPSDRDCQCDSGGYGGVHARDCNHPGMGQIGEKPASDDPSRQDAQRGPGPPDPDCDCGSGCDGRTRPWDCNHPGLGQMGEKLVARDVAQRIRQHIRDRGDAPAGWQRWADETLEPVISWQRVLSSMVRRGIADVAGRVDFTYRRPSRRASAFPDVILPSLRQPIPQVAMVLDTSGSMSDQMLGQALAEVSGVLRGLGVGRRYLRVVCCDANAYQAQRVLDARDVRLLGGGGTDMGAGLAAAAALKPRPDVLIVLTDGHTPWPQAPPAGSRVIVGLMDPHGRVPDWAKAVTIEPPAGTPGW